MERYESLGPVGEGSYGTVLKCRHRDSGHLVAIKKFMDSDDDKTVKKIALREIKLLRQLRHDNLVNLLEVWRRRRRWYLVFEFVERTLLDDLEQNPSGLDLNTSRQYLYQILRATSFCHQQNIIHRDIKPENILISQGGVVKLCDFGFARAMASPNEGSIYTDYVATRWYRAPELLVGDTKYGKPVDVWAVGCLPIEMLTGQPLFPGDSDVDQIYRIIRFFGNLTAHHQDLFYRNPVFSGIKLPEYSSRMSLEQRFPAVATIALDLAQLWNGVVRENCICRVYKECLQMAPERRAQCSELLEHPLFTQDSFHVRFLDELNAKIQKGYRENSTLPKIIKTQRRERDEEDEKNHRSMKKKERKEEEKTKGKQPSKHSKPIQNTSEPLVSVKLSKTVGAKMTTTVKSKTGKAPKTLTWDSLESHRNAAALMVDNTTEQRPNLETVDCLGSNPSLDENPIESKLCRLSTLESGQESGKSCNNTRVTKMCKSSTPHHQDWSTPQKAIDGTSKTLKMVTTTGDWPCDTSSDHQTNQLTMDTHQSPEYPRVLYSNPKPTTSNASTRLSKYSSSPSTTHSMDLPELDIEMLKKGNLEASKTYVSSFIKAANNWTCDTTSDRQTDQSNVDTGQTKTSDCPKVLCSDLKPTTSNTRTKMSKHSTSTNLSNTPTLDLPQQSSVHMEIIKKGTQKVSTADSPSVQPSKSLPAEREQMEQSIIIKRRSRDPTMCETSLVTKITGIDNVYDPESSAASSKHLQIKSTTEPLLTETPKTTTMAGTNFPKRLAVSDEENRGVTGATKASKFSRGHEQNCGRVETNTKSAKASHSKCSIGQPTAGGNTSSTCATTSEDVTGTRRGGNELTNIPAFSESVSVEPYYRLSNMDAPDLHKFDRSENTTPPPTPSTPPSSIPLIPSLAAVTANIPSTSNHLSLGSRLYPGTHSLRSLDKPRHHSGVCTTVAHQSLSSHITGSITAEAMERSATCCGLYNSGGQTVTRKKSDVHFPDLKSLVLPELRGGEGKHSKCVTKDQRNNKPVVPSIPPSEPQQQEHTGK